MALNFCPLFSGSSGNAVYVGNGQTHILVDCGKPGKTIETALRSIHVDPAQLSAILVTHEHYDHISGVGVLSRKYNLPVYTTPGTWAGMSRTGSIKPHNARHIETYADQYGDFFLGRINVQPFKTSHDAAESVGFIFTSDGVSAGLATDLGVFPSKLVDILSGLRLLMLESNHDEALLAANRRYTEALKKRILGKYGHLSNTFCGKAIAKLYSTGVSHVILAHLSDDNNNPTLALETVTRVLLENGIRVGEDIAIDIAPRDKRGDFYSLESLDDMGEII